MKAQGAGRERMIVRRWRHRDVRHCMTGSARYPERTA